MYFGISIFWLTASVVTAGNKKSPITDSQYALICKEVDHGLKILPEFEKMFIEWKEIVLDDYREAMKSSLQYLNTVTITKDTPLRDYEFLIKDGMCEFIESRDVLYTSLTYGTFKFVELIGQLKPVLHIMFSTEDIWSTKEPRSPQDKIKFEKVGKMCTAIKTYIDEITVIVREMTQMVERERMGNLLLSKLNSIMPQITQGNAMEINGCVVNSNNELQGYNSKYFGYLNEKVRLFNACVLLFKEIESMCRQRAAEAAIQSKLTMHGLRADEERKVNHIQLSAYLKFLYAKLTFNIKFSSARHESNGLPARTFEGQHGSPFVTKFVNASQGTCDENEELRVPKPLRIQEFVDKYALRISRLKYIKDAIDKGRPIAEAKQRLEEKKKEKADARAKTLASQTNTTVQNTNNDDTTPHKQGDGGLKNLHYALAPLVVMALI